MDRLRLEVEHGGFDEVSLTNGSARLTETDKQYRKQFLDTVQFVVHSKHACKHQDSCCSHKESLVPLCESA